MRMMSLAVVTGLLFAIVSGCGDELTVNETTETIGTADLISNARSYSELAETGVPIERAAGVVVPARLSKSFAGLHFYSVRSEFRKAGGNRLPVERFEGSNFPKLGQCPGPLESSTGGNGCYDPGDLETGFVLYKLDPDEQIGVVRPSSIFDVKSTVVGPNFFDDDTRLTFPGAGVDAVSFKLVDPFGDSVWEIEVFGSGGSLGSAQSGAGFVGFISDEKIVEILVTPVSGTAGELFDNLAFGDL